MANAVITMLAHASYAATANSASSDFQDYKSGWFEIRVSNVSGTNPTLDIVLQQSNDGTNWTTCYTSAQITTISTVHVFIPNATQFGFGRYLRAAYTIGGTATPTFTFGVSAMARTV